VYRSTLGILPLPNVFGIETTIRRLLDALPEADADRILRLSLNDFLEETPALQRAERFNMIREHIKRSLASSVVVGARKPVDCERRQAAMLNEVGEDRLARAKRGYCAARVAVIAMHYEVLFYKERAGRRGADCRDYPLPAAISTYLEQVASTIRSFSPSGKSLFKNCAKMSPNWPPYGSAI
jgi:hypothetical protein